VLRVIEAADAVELCQEQMRAAVDAVTTQKQSQLVGFPGGTQEATIHYVQSLDFWMTFKLIENRYWNCGGLGYPFKGGSPAPSVEINPPLSGIDRRMAGAFLEDEDGVVYVAHNGKIGGGTKGVSKTNFLAKYRDWSWVLSGDRKMPMYVIGRLDDPRLPRKLRDFTRRSADFRSEIKAGKAQDLTDLPDDEEGFVREFEGTKRYRTSDQVEADCIHGLVVNALRDTLASCGIDSFNTIARDLYVPGLRKKTKILFEVKSSADTTSIYGAVGQLMFHGGVGLAETLVAVLPTDVDATTQGRLAALGISTVTFAVNAAEVVTFAGLDEVLKRRP